MYNVNAVNSGLSTDDRVLKLTAQVKDCSCCGAMSHTTVSYTHLDVYKRQALYLALSNPLGKDH